MSTKPVSEAKDYLFRWAKVTRGDLAPLGIYVFGSLIYRDGTLFGDRSDIDIVVVIPETPDAIDRADWLEKLLRHKISLEDELGKVLRRPSRDTLICSIVAVTSLEISSDIHKDGARNFFSANTFLDLVSGQIVNGLPNAGSREIKERLVGECIRFAQKTRSSYLGVNALGAETLRPFDDADAAPKQLMRHAAMVQYLEDDGDGDPGREYDVDIGATHLTVLLHERRKKVADLGRRFEARRSGRGTRAPLSSKDQLLLSEIVLDTAIYLEARATAIQAKPKRPSIGGAHSTVIFAKRFESAFPGVRGVEWFEDSNQIRQRVARLLEEPLEFEDGTPIWWSRGNSNLQIFSFADEGDRFVLNGEEMNIRRVAAINPGSYKYEFVYVELAPLQPTGLYPRTQENIAEVERGDGFFPYYWEEYGIVDGKHFVTRAVYDDGSAFIDGELQSLRGRAELRSRYVTTYNFLVAASGSPLFDSSYDQQLEDHLNAMLRGEDRLDAIARDGRQLPTGRF
ncbi:nucleotidyltransferase domain-containing protein [Mesorhizobium sp. ISC15]|uniref:nucleotidyltransferase domain-containing protein n=1 Tax=Mesorhizobium sp. ISC15 TaxID=3076429 RepID=UPI00301DC589